MDLFVRILRNSGSSGSTSADATWAAATLRRQCHGAPRWPCAVACWCTESVAAAAARVHKAAPLPARRPQDPLLLLRASRRSKNVYARSLPRLSRRLYLTPRRTAAAPGWPTAAPLRQATEACRPPSVLGGRGLARWMTCVPRPLWMQLALTCRGPWRWMAASRGRWSARRRPRARVTVHATCGSDRPLTPTPPAAAARSLLRLVTLWFGRKLILVTTCVQAGFISVLRG